MSTVVVANAAMQPLAVQPWADDAERFPRAVPAALRMTLDSGYTREGEALYFTALGSQVSGDLESMLATTVEREGFMNKLQLGALKPTLRLDNTTPEWACECVAIGLALWAMLLSHENVIVTISLDFGDDVEYRSSTFRFTTDDWAGDLSAYSQAVLVMRRA